MAAKTAGTWIVYDRIGVGDLTAFGTTLLYPLGTKVKAEDKGSTAYGLGEFIYLEGVGSTVRGSVVYVTDEWATVLVVARGMGAVAVSLSANAAAASYGWYQILGKAVAACDTVADAAPCYIDGTAGRIDDAAVAGDAVMGMRTASADDTSTCIVTMATYPSVADFDNA